MVSLAMLNEGVPSQKQWLTPVFYNMQALDADVDTVTMHNRAPGGENPPEDHMRVFTDLNGVISATDYAGTTVKYVHSGSGPGGNAVQSDGKSVSAGNIPEYEDDSGVLVGDSGVSVAVIPAIENTAGVIAPAGLRDLWSLGDAGNIAPGAGLIYDDNTDHLLAFGSDDSIGYSTDGGATFTLGTFDVAPPAGAGLILGFNGVLYLASSFDAAPPPIWTSTDGENWTEGGTLPASLYSNNMIYFKGLWILGTYEGGAAYISSSDDDGKTWANDITIDTLDGITALASNDDVAVAISVLAPFVLYSTDGHTWLTNGTGLTVAYQTVCYSAERKEFLALKGGGGGFCATSQDGKNWTEFVNSFPPAGVSYVTWVGHGINRYYGCALDTTGTYSLWETTEAKIPFSSTQMDGAVALSQTYGWVVYMPSRNSFALGLHNPPRVAKSQARAGSIKAQSDNIRVRGAPVSTGKYSTYGDTQAFHTAAEVNISTTPNAIGTLVYQPNIPIGMITKFDLMLALTSAAGDTLTIRYKANGNEVFNHVITVPAASTSVPCNIQTSIAYRSGSLNAKSIEFFDGAMDIVNILGVGFTNTAALTWSVTAQWGVNLNVATMSSLYVETVFSNGA